VLQLIKKNIRMILCRQLLLLSVVLLFSLFAIAQEEEKEAVIVADTAELPEVVTDDTAPDEVGVKDEKQYFNRKSDTLSIIQRTLPGDVVKKMREDDDFWYANADIKNNPSKEKVQQEKEGGKISQKEKNEQAIKEERQRDDTYVPVGQRPWFQTLLWIIIIAGFATVLFMYLSGSNIGLFRKKNVKAATSDEEDVITEDIFAINYQKEIDKAAALGNHRLAIRLMFLRVLKSMSEKNIIRYKQDKTNLDYLLELQPTGYYTSFFGITRNYEYSWYGKFPVSEDAYTLIRKDFDKFEKQLQ